jgi:diacylglycerol kinase family enzyme
VRLLVIHNANAGHDGDRRDSLVAALDAAGHSTFSACKGRAEIRRALEAEVPDAVVVLGGDGSVTAVARELIDTDIPIVPVPAGTANNLALFLEAGEDPLPALQRGRRVALDVGVCDFGDDSKMFLEGAGWGPFPDAIALLTGMDADAMVDGREDELERDGRLLKETAARAQARWCRLELDGRELASHFVLAEVLNIGNVGPNLRLAPDADPSDGLLDVVVVDDVDRSELVAYLSARIGDRTLPAPFAVQRARQIRLRINEPVRLHVDDRLVERDEPLEVTITVRPRAVTFLV